MSKKLKNADDKLAMKKVVKRKDPHTTGPGRIFSTYALSALVDIITDSNNDYLIDKAADEIGFRVGYDENRLQNLIDYHMETGIKHDCPAEIRIADALIHVIINYV